MSKAEQEAAPALKVLENQPVRLVEFLIDKAQHSAVQAVIQAEIERDTFLQELASGPASAFPDAGRKKGMYGKVLIEEDRADAFLTEIWIASARDALPTGG